MIIIRPVGVVIAVLFKTTMANDDNSNAEKSAFSLFSLKKLRKNCRNHCLGFFDSLMFTLAGLLQQAISIEFEQINIYGKTARIT